MPRTVHDPDKVIAICDHASPSPSEQVSNVRIMMRRFALENGILFYENGDGVCHQVAAPHRVDNVAPVSKSQECRLIGSAMIVYQREDGGYADCRVCACGQEGG